MYIMLIYHHVANVLVMVARAFYVYLNYPGSGPPLPYHIIMETQTVRPTDTNPLQYDKSNILNTAKDDDLSSSSIRTGKRLESDLEKSHSILNEKIASSQPAQDPFKSLYLTELRSKSIPSQMPSPLSSSVATDHSLSSATSKDETKSGNDEQLTCLNGKFQALTLQRVLALRKVQASIQSAPNTSFIGAPSTTFAEEDLKCLSMEELQALQRRKNAVSKDIQPVSVVKVSIQGERTRKRLEPRDYQIELYERARRENTIAVLGTGTGKTLIACLLIKDILVQERASRVKGFNVYVMR
jgi:hypothetical protein